MLSLISIRVKYILRHPVLLFLSYLLIPILISIASFFMISNNDKDYDFVKKESPFLIPDIYYNFTSNSYENLVEYLNFTLFLVDKEIDCKVVEEFIKSKFDNFKDEYFHCSHSEKDANNENKKEKEKINRPLYSRKYYRNIKGKENQGNKNENI